MTSFISQPDFPFITLLDFYIDQIKCNVYVTEASDDQFSFVVRGFATSHEGNKHLQAIAERVYREEIRLAFEDWRSQHPHGRSKPAFS